jgi:ribonuclease Z
MLRLTFLGTGGAYPNSERDCMTLLLDWSGGALLLDCGPTVTKQLYRLGHELKRISTIAITHFHGDHVLGLPFFVFGCLIERRQAPLLVLCPEKDVDSLLSLIELCFPGTLAKLPFSLNVKGLKPENKAEAVKTEDFTIKAVSANHTVSSLSYCVEFQSLGKTLVYSGDTRPNERLVEIGERCDLLIHDSTFSDSLKDYADNTGHSTARQAAKIANIVEAKTLALVHLHPMYNGKEDTLLDEAKQVFGGIVVVPSDLQSIDL